tara:strand:- start:2209 stop:4044 length:1836 start_codon:yes stop_codon:yes gene_type:complete
MQNIIQAEDDVKGMPDQALQQMAQRPDGRYPQFLVVSEIQRRSNMRKRFESQQQPQGTVKDQIVQQGIASLAPPPPQMQQAMGVPQQMPQQMPQGAPMPPQMPPQGMYAGGVVNMNAGQQVPYVSYSQRQFGRGIPLPQLTDAGREATASLYGGITQQRPGELETLYRNELVGMPMEEYDALLAQGYTPTMTGGLSREGQPRDTVMFDPELAQRLTGSDKFRSEFFDTGMDSGINEDYNRAILAEFAQNNPDKFSMISASDSPRAYLKMIEDLEGIEGEGSGQASGPADTSYLDDPMFDEFPPVDSEQPPKNDDVEAVSAVAAPIVQQKDAEQLVGSNALLEDAGKSNDPLAKVAAALGKKNQAVSAYEAMIERANTRATQYETEAATRASELQADAKKDMLANALIELGSGIAGGDFAGGLSRAGRTAADLKARVGAEARAEQRSGREMAEAARQRAEGLTLEEMAKAKEEERYQESVNTAASQFAAQMADKVAARKFTAGQSEADRAAQLERIEYQLAEGFVNDQALLDKKLDAARVESEGRQQATNQQAMIELVEETLDNYTNRAMLEAIIDPDEREIKRDELRANLMSQFRPYFTSQSKYKVTEVAN